MNSSTTTTRAGKQQAGKKAGTLVNAAFAPDAAVPIRRLDHVMKTLQSKGISTRVLHAVTALYLNEDGDMSMGDLAAKIGVTSAAVTSVADGIERLGFARRVVNSNDRRSIYFRLTERGIVFIEWLSSMLDPGVRDSAGLPG